MSVIWAYLDRPSTSPNSGNSLEVGPEIDLESDLEMDLEVDLETGLEIGFEVDCDPEIGFEVGSEIGSEMDSEMSSEIGSGMGSEYNPEMSPESESSPESSPETSPSDAPALEWLFQLCCLFWVDGSATGNMAHLPLVYFSGVLGIHRSSLAYRTAYHYTPFAAGLIWIGRQLLLEYALPKEPYLALNWPAAASYRNQLRRLQYIQSKYLCRGSAYPMSRLLETLAYGRAIAKKEGPRANIS